MAGDVVKVQGLDKLLEKFKQIPLTLRKRILRGALVAGARLVRDEAKRNAPLLSGARKAPYRTRGTVRDAIAVRTSKAERKAGNVGVFVNVKPLPGNKYKTVTTKGWFGGVAKHRALVKRTARGATNPKDPFYWRWLEYGTRKMGKREFLAKGAGRLNDALTAFEQKVDAWLASVEAGGPAK